MRLFWEVARMSFQRQLSYRLANLAGLATNLFFGLLRASVLIALYGARTEVAGITLQGAITYTGLTQAVIAYLSFFGWYEVMNTVYNGSIAGDLLKPASYFSYWMSQDLGRAFANLLLRALTLMAGYALIFRISLPHAPAQWLALGLAIVFSWMVSFAWRFLVNLAAFWTPNAAGIGRFLFGISWIFSGFIMPLRFFPDWFYRLAQLTPFPAIINTVVEVYLGVLTGPALWLALAQQLAWFVILALAAQLVLRLGVRTLVVQGG